MVSIPFTKLRFGPDTLPLWISHWLGYRNGPTSTPPAYALYVWPFIGSFASLAILQAIFGHSNYFLARGVPALLPSYGASAMLTFQSPGAPLAQPRALIGGHFFSALVGIVVTRIIWGATPLEQAESRDLSWVGGSFATAISILVMQVTGTIHPPAGATALLPVLDSAVNALGFYFLPVVLLSSVMMMVVGLLINNLQRRYPTFWWAPEESKPDTPEEPKPTPSVPSVASESV